MTHQDSKFSLDNVPTPPPPITNRISLEVANSSQEENIYPKTAADLDAILVQKSCEGDQQAFTCLFNRYRNKIFRTIYLMVHNTEDTWDLLQDSFMKAYKSLRNLKKQQTFYSWLISIAVNTTINHINKREKLQKIQEILRLEWRKRSQSSIHHNLEKDECRRMLQKIIAQIPIKQRSVLILSEIEGYKYKEISEILNCPIGTVMSRLFYARNFIREQLGPSFQIEDMPSQDILETTNSMEEEWD